MKKLIVIVLFCLSLSALFSLGSGLYDYAYSIFLSGYNINKLGSYPKQISYYKWDVFWELRRTDIYTYTYNEKGQIVKIEKTDQETGKREEYHYLYLGENCIYAKHLFFNKNENKPRLINEIKIQYNDTGFIEKYYSDNELDNIYYYFFDNEKRIASIKNEYFNPFAEKMVLSFIWEVSYKGETRVIEKINKKFYDTKGNLTEDRKVPYSYEGEKTMIQNADWLETILTYNNELLTKIEILSPQGEYANDLTTLKYDTAGRLLEEETIGIYKSGAVGSGARYVMEY
jgi:hypothetical protein